MISPARSKPRHSTRPGGGFQTQLGRVELTEDRKMTYLTRQQVREVDRRAIEEYRIPGIVLMENAARAVADAAWRMLGRKPGRKSLILCGGGNNGGDGLAAARHLHNLGADVSIAVYGDPSAYKGDALTNWQIVQAMKLPCFPAEPDALLTTDADLLIDGVFGTGLTEPPRPPFPQLVEAIATTAKPVLAIDVPSGLDCDSGQPLGACIEATATVTFVAPKAGFANRAARKFTGRVIVGDIGCPAELIEQVLRGLPSP